MSKPILTFVTGNANKLREVQAILASAPDFPYDVQSCDLDLPEIQGTTQEVATAKCRAAAEKIRGPCLTEDTSLSFSALNGMPGPYIKHFMQAVGHDGLNRMLDGFPSREAEALCTFAFCAGPSPSQTPPDIHLFEGRTLGRVVPARGPTHFGWDAIFEAEQTGQTFAEMDKAKKNSISHRYRSLALLQAFLTSQ